MIGNDSRNFRGCFVMCCSTCNSAAVSLVTVLMGSHRRRDGCRKSDRPCHGSHVLLMVVSPLRLAGQGEMKGEHAGFLQTLS